MSAIDLARQVVEQAVTDRIFPAASVDVGDSSGSLWSDAFGSLSPASGAPQATIETPFDLASLTKVIATSTVMMELLRLEQVRLEDLVSAYFPAWRGRDRATATIRDLLEHASGLPARLAEGTPIGRRGFEDAICTVRLDDVPGARSIYSDLDFILLGFLAADCGGASLDALFDRIMTAIHGGPARDRLTFTVPNEVAPSTAPTIPLPDDPRRGGILAGQVHDAYAAALGGVAGHAGLFGTARRVGAFGRLALRAVRGEPNLPPPFVPAIVRRFVTRSSVRASSRALGWDTMLPTSSCGERMASAAFGHTGFTGTSLWIDPVRDRYFVLLSNRAYGGGTIEQMRNVRRAFHNALGDF